jgi:hypothetical protein
MRWLIGDGRRLTHRLYQSEHGKCRGNLSSDAHEGRAQFGPGLSRDGLLGTRAFRDACRFGLAGGILPNPPRRARPSTQLAFTRVQKPRNAEDLTAEETQPQGDYQPAWPRRGHEDKPRKRQSRSANHDDPSLSRVEPSPLLAAPTIEILKTLAGPVCPKMLPNRFYFTANGAAFPGIALALCG